MIWILLIFFLILLLLLWLPLEVLVDTEEDLYMARWRGIFALRTTPESGKWRIFYRVLFWEKEYIFSKKTPKKVETAPKKEKKPAKKRKRPSLKFLGILFRQLLKALHFKKLYINLDTDDYVLNAWLYPVFWAGSTHNRQLLINFRGQQEAALHLQTRLITLSGAALRAYFKYRSVKHT